MSGGKLEAEMITMEEVGRAGQIFLTAEFGEEAFNLLCLSMLEWHNELDEE